MSIQKDIEQIILLNKKNILLEIDILKENLGIAQKFNKLVNYIDEIESIYLRNIDFTNRMEDLKKQLLEDQHKTLEMWCKVKNKKLYVKNFGTIDQADDTTIINLIRFITLVRLIKQIDNATYYASRYYESAQLLNDLRSINTNH